MAVAIYVLQQRRRHRIPRVFRDRENPLDYMHDDELIARYRLNRETIIQLCGDLEPYLNRPTKRSQSLSVSLQILIALRYYATGTFLSMVGDGHTVGKMSASRSIHRVTSALLHYINQYINFPRTAAEQAPIKIQFYEIAFPRVVGAVDGSLIPIKSPTIDEHVYVSRKGYHALNIQAISDSDSLFRQIVARWPGSTHDSFVWSNSQIAYDFEEGNMPPNVWLLGDSGYPCKPWLLPPFLNPRTQAERKYNRAHKKTRSVIERCFGVWKSRFRCLYKSAGYILFTPDKCCKIVIATAILHNICILNRVPLVEELEQEAEEFVYEGQDQDGHRGRAVQQYFTE